MSIRPEDVRPGAVFEFPDGRDRRVVSTMTGTGLAEMQVHWQYEGHPAGIAEAFGANGMPLSQWLARAVRLAKPAA